MPKAAKKEKVVEDPSCWPAGAPNVPPLHVQTWGIVQKQKVITPQLLTKGIKMPSKVFNLTDWDEEEDTQPLTRALKRTRGMYAIPSRFYYAKDYPVSKFL